DSIEIKEELQGQGWGSKILREICDFADQNNLIVVLTPAEKNTNKLVKWYKSFDFLENKGRNKDFRWAIRMIRYPHGLTRSKWIASRQASAESKVVIKSSEEVNIPAHIVEEYSCGKCMYLAMEMN